MTRKSVVVLILILSVLSVAIWAQSRRDPTAPTVVPGVISGENVGVRVTGPSGKSGKVVAHSLLRLMGSGSM